MHLVTVLAITLALAQLGVDSCGFFRQMPILSEIKEMEKADIFETDIHLQLKKKKKKNEIASKNLNNQWIKNKISSIFSSAVYSFLGT